MSTKLPPNAFPRYPSHLCNLRPDWANFADVEVINNDGRFVSDDDDEASSDDFDLYGDPAAAVAIEAASTSSPPTWFEQTSLGFQRRGGAEHGQDIRGEAAMERV